MSNPYAEYQYNGPQPRRRSRRGPVAMIIIGILLMVLGPVIGFTASIFGLVNRIDISELEGQQAISNPGTTGTLQPGSWTVIASPVTSGYSCDVMTSLGQGLPTSTNATTQYPSFDLPAADTVTIECDAGQDLYVIQSYFIDDLIGDVAGIAAPVMIGMALGFVGFVLLIAGIIWFVVAGRRNMEEEYRRGGYGGGGYGGGGYGGGAYGAAGYGSGGHGGSSYGTDGYGASPHGQTGYDPHNPYAVPNPHGQQAPPPQYGQNWDEPTQHGEQRDHGQNRDEPPRYGERLDP